MSIERFPIAATLAVLALLTSPATVLAAEAAPADADTPVATGKGQSAPPATPQTEIQTADDSLVSSEEDGKPDRKPHGFISAGVGTHGYREVAGAVTLPIGETGQVTIAIDDAHIDGRRR